MGPRTSHTMKQDGCLILSTLSWGAPTGGHSSWPYTNTHSCKEDRFILVDVSRSFSPCMVSSKVYRTQLQGSWTQPGLLDPEGGHG